MSSKLSNEKYIPTMKDMLLLPGPIPVDSRLSPDGKKLAYLCEKSNLKDNKDETYCYVYDINTDQTFQLTKTGTVSNIRWINNQSLALLKSTNYGSQIYLFEGLIGEGLEITNHDGGIQSFEPFSNGFAFIATSPEKNEKRRKQKQASFIHVEEEESTSALYYTGIDEIKKYKEKLRHSFPHETENLINPVIELSQLLDNSLTIESIITKPKSDILFINCRKKDDLIYQLDSSCFRIQIDAESALEKIITQRIKDQRDIISHLGKLTVISLPKGARIRCVSPDGSRLIISHRERDQKQYTQPDLWILDIIKNEDKLESPNLYEQFTCITKNLDQWVSQVYWTKKGIYVSYWVESTAKIAKLSESKQAEEIDLGQLSPYFFFVNDTDIISFVASSPTAIGDIYIRVPKAATWEVKRVTKNTDRVSNWDLGTVESIKWKSKDGTEIEGILRKPSNFDPNKKYPLLFQIHGGPAWVSPYVLVEGMDRYYFPAIQFSQNDILVLKPNYRGSLGKGQAFLELGVDNVGIGDLWDIESAIDHLVAQGFVDETKIGCMGWSQGGYISAFVGMHSTRFTAVSAGATVSNWYTFFISSDVRYSLNISGSPFEKGKREIYDKTAPISGIDKAKTPMLLQHAQNDQRISVVSAMELHRALKDRGIKTELFVYPGMGHGITSPVECYSVMAHNFRWFMHYLKGEELDLNKYE